MPDQIDTLPEEWTEERKAALIALIRAATDHYYYDEISYRPPVEYVFIASGEPWQWQCTRCAQRARRKAEIRHNPECPDHQFWRTFNALASALDTWQEVNK